MRIVDKNNNLLIRLDAGKVFGLGHLSRCISLAESFIPEFNIHFIIKTDDKSKIQDFIVSNCPVLDINLVQFISTSIDVMDELKLIVKIVKELNGFLIVDHYTVNTEYQLFLRYHNVKWLQFDSHGKIDLYADLVLHGSPGATHEIYDPLVKDARTKLLIGTNYAIVNKNFLESRKSMKVRQSVNRIMVCFGGGHEKGATLKFLRCIDFNLIDKIELFLLVSDRNSDLKDIIEITKEKKKVHLLINSSEVHKIMLECDLAIIAPGTLSYESASVGLPMLLVIIADNQNINVNGWTRIGAAINLGLIEKLNSDILNSNIELLINHPERLKSMSINSSKSVDGLAPLRVRDEILSIT